MPLNENQKKALDLLIEKAEASDHFSDSDSVSPFAWTPVAVEVTMMVAATVAGNCRTPDDVKLDQEDFVKQLKEVSSFEELKQLRNQ